MIKEDIKKSLEEMKRVLVPGGLMFVNFVSTTDERCGTGEEVRPGEYYEVEHGGGSVTVGYVDYIVEKPL